MMADDSADSFNAHDGAHDGANDNSWSDELPEGLTAGSCIDSSSSSAGAGYPCRTEPGSGLECSVLIGTSVSSLRLRGELDVENADLLMAAVTEQIAQHRVNMYVDMTEVTFCDLAGLDALNRARRHAEQAGGQLLVRGVSDLLQRIAPICGVHGLFENLPPTGSDGGDGLASPHSL